MATAHLPGCLRQPSQPAQAARSAAISPSCPAHAHCCSHQALLQRPTRHAQPCRQSSHALRAAADAALLDESVVQAPEIAQEKLRIKLKAYDHRLLQQAVDMVLEAARTTGARVGGAASLPTKKRIYCVLTSPHVNKNAREHFEIRTHKRIIDVRDLPTETIDKLFSLEIPAGVSVKVET